MTIDVEAIRAMVAATSDRYEVTDDMLTITFLPDATDSPEWWGRDYAACITLPPGDAAYFAEGRATMLALCDALDAEREAHAETTAQFEEYHTLATRLFEDLDAERERVRVLHSAGGYLYTVVQLHWARSGTSDDDAEAAMRAWQRVLDALAATEDGGGA
jgi:hypothetical protein